MDRGRVPAPLRLLLVCGFIWARALSPAAETAFEQECGRLAARAGADSERLHALFKLDWEKTMQESPEFATMVGYPGQNDRWTDESLEAIAARKRELPAALKVLESVDRARLNPSDQLNYDLFRRNTEQAIEGARFKGEYMPVTQLNGPQQDAAELLDLSPHGTVKDYEDILARLNGLPRLLEQTVVLMDKGLESEITPPRITLRDVPRQIEAQMAADPATNALLKPFYEFPSGIPEHERERLRQSAATVLKEKVIPAFGKLCDFFTNTYLPGTRETIALSALPDGQAWYAYNLRVLTTTSLTPEQIHALGLSEVKRIRGEMDKIIAQTGLSFPEFSKFLRTDPRFFYTDAESLLSGYRDIAKRADPELARLFGKLPRLPYGVKAIPPAAARSQTAAYYEPGSPQAGRPGWLMANTYALDSRPKWEMVALTLHEAVPGHHLQIALAQEMEGAPEFRKYGMYTAFVEGWGLYAEGLGDEMGLYKDPYLKYGQLTFEMWRAIRLVLDTGIHALGWGRQEAIEYFLSNASRAERDIIVEVDRYIVWPGQATAYKIGEMKLKELRAYATQELGASFDIRQFHDEVLGNGALPLDVLEKRIKEWVGQKRRGVAAQTAALPAGAPRRGITEKDLFDFIWVANPEISPDGTRVAFTRVSVDEKRTGYESSIWTAATSGSEPPVRMTNGKHDSQPRWSPDGKRLAFVRGGGKDETGQPKPAQLALLSLAGGEAWTLTDLPKGAAGPVWSPDSRRIAFLSSTTPEDLAKAQHKKTPTKSGESKGAQGTESTAQPKPPKPESEHESDAHIISRAVYRDNAKGYLDPKRHQHIWVLDLPSASDELATPRQLTRGDFDEGEIVWSRDNLRLYFLTQRIEEPYYELPATDIYSVPATGGSLEKLATVPMRISGLSLSPEGRKFAFHGSATQPIRSYSQPDLWVMDVASNAQPRNLTVDYDFDMGSSVGGDNAAPGGGHGRALYWSPDGRWLFDSVGKRGRTALVRVDAQSGAVTEITQGDQAVLDFSVAPDAPTMVALISTPLMVGDLFTVAANGAQTRITDFNHKLWSELDLSAPEEIDYASFDGQRIEGWIQKPPSFDPQEKYPLILNIHGGPHAAYGWVFDHEFQWMAAKGYVVLYLNPRGSSTYGQDFGNLIQYHYPGDDYRDLMIGVDELLKRGYIDPKKLAVTGGSGGGVLTDWTITHTERFAAAVSQRDISNWASWWYTADFTLFQPHWFEAPPFEDPQAYANRSAITFVKNIHTPVMFVLGEADYRTPPDSGGEQLFRALKFLKRPTAMVVFPRETHELSRSGEPWHRIERLDHIVGWFDKWIRGVPHPEYDVGPENQAEVPNEKPELSK